MDSKLIEKTEYLQISNALGGAVLLGTTVVRLYKGQRNQWNYTKIIGAVCICEQQGVMYFKIVDLKNFKCVWEQELYENFEYNKTVPYFHTFEINDCVAGFSFADEDAANKFFQTVQTKIPRAGGASNSRTSIQPPRSNTSLTREDSTKDITKKKEKKKESSGGFLSGLFGNKKEAEVSISSPENFRHESHIGWDPEHGFEIRNIPPQWRKLFQAAGIKKSDLKDAETVKFVMDVVSQNLPTGSAPPAPPKRGGAPPPPPAARAGAPPPPPMTRGNAPPPPAPRGAPGGGGGGGGPAPPPPPPPPGLGGPPSRTSSAPPPPSYGGGGGGGGGDDYSANDYGGSGEDMSNTSGGRDGLLAQIRQGTQLKKADDRAISELPELDEQTSDNLASILASAMAARRVDMKLKPAADEEEEDADGWSD